MKKVLIVMLFISLNVYSAFSFALFRDPTRPPENMVGQTAVSPSMFTLNAVLIDGERKIAVINGVHKKMGEDVLGQRITAIHENTVQLEGPNGRITLFLSGKPIKDSGQVICKRNFDLCEGAN